VTPMTDLRSRIEFTPEAEARLADYLQQVRAALAGSTDVNADEIAADIQAHVETELRGAFRLVTRSELEAILARLGPPSQWLPEQRPGAPSLNQYVRERLRAIRRAVWRGPEDWRLAYLTFAVFAVGVLTVVFFPLFLVVSYFLARAGVACARENGVEIGAGRKWLLYPPLAIVSVVLLAGFMLGPPMVATATIAAVAQDADHKERRQLVGAMYDIPQYERNRTLMKRHPDVVTSLDRVLAPFSGSRDTREALSALFLGAGLLGVWWLIVGMLAVSFPATGRAVFPPLCNGLQRRHGWKLAGLAVVLLLAWGVAAFEIAAEVGLLR
jgi:hypothetical protein